MYIKSEVLIKMVEFNHIVKSSAGVHARPAGRINGVAKKFESEIAGKSAKKFNFFCVILFNFYV